MDAEAELHLHRGRASELMAGRSKEKVSIMGWSIGWDEKWQRDIGYGVTAYCDFPGCDAQIDRGLSYVCCGAQPYGGDGCGLYFCEKHGNHALRGHWNACSRCANYRPPFKPKADHPEWNSFKETDPSWAGWRKERNRQAFKRVALS